MGVPFLSGAAPRPRHAHAMVRACVILSRPRTSGFVSSCPRLTPGAWYAVEPSPLQVLWPGESVPEVEDIQDFVMLANQVRRRLLRHKVPATQPRSFVVVSRHIRRH